MLVLDINDMSYDFDCQTKKVVSCSHIPFSILIADFMVIHDSYKALEVCNQNNFHIFIDFWLSLN